MADATLRPINPLQGMPLPAAPLPGAPLPVQRTTSSSAHADAMKKVAEEFEAVFLNEMMGPMFEGLDTDGLGGGGVGEEMFRPMLIDQYARSISQSGGVGIAANIIAEFNRMQAQTAAAPPAEEQPPIPIGQRGRSDISPEGDDNGPAR